MVELILTYRERAALVLAWWLAVGHAAQTPEGLSSEDTEAGKALKELLNETMAEIEDQGFSFEDEASRARAPLSFCQETFDRCPFTCKPLFSILEHVTNTKSSDAVSSTFAREPQNPAKPSIGQHVTCAGKPVLENALEAHPSRGLLLTVSSVQGHDRCGSVMSQVENTPRVPGKGGPWKANDHNSPRYPSQVRFFWQRCQETAPRTPRYVKEPYYLALFMAL